MDQLSALKSVESLAALSGVHANLEARIYNPVRNRARIGYPGYVFAGLCCWRKLNQRIHTKLLLVDGAMGITGGRNYQDAHSCYSIWPRTAVSSSSVVTRNSRDGGRCCYGLTRDM
jgi:phosphatidylserine/phosphatidylglycerophosphate/cardiolipin synthase-like enzyme